MRGTSFSAGGGAAAAAAVGLALVLAGCFAAAPNERGDFGVTEVAEFVANDGAFCVSGIAYDDVGDQVWLLDYMGGVQRYAPDGAFLGTAVDSVDAWRALHPEAIAYTGAEQAVVVDADGAAFRMTMADGALDPVPMDGRLGDSMTLDAARGRLVATPAIDFAATTADDGTPASTLVLLDAASGAPAGQLIVGAPSVDSVSYAADLDTLVVLTNAGLLLLVDPDTGDTLAWGEGPGSAAKAIAYDASHGRIWSVNWALSYRVHAYQIDRH